MRQVDLIPVFAFSVSVVDGFTPSDGPFPSGGAPFPLSEGFSPSSGKNFRCSEELVRPREDPFGNAEVPASRVEELFGTSEELFVCSEEPASLPAHHNKTT